MPAIPTTPRLSLPMTSRRPRPPSPIPLRDSLPPGPRSLGKPTTKIARIPLAFPSTAYPSPFSRRAAAGGTAPPSADLIRSIPPPPLSAPPPATWSYTLPAALQGALTSGSTYFIISISTDNAANPEFGSLAVNIPSNAGVTVVYDTVAPTAVINVPVLASTSGVISLSSPHFRHRLRRCRYFQYPSRRRENPGQWSLDGQFFLGFSVGPVSNPNFLFP